MKTTNFSLFRPALRLRTLSIHIVHITLLGLSAPFIQYKNYSKWQRLLFPLQNPLKQPLKRHFCTPTSPLLLHVSYCTPLLSNKLVLLPPTYAQNTHARSPKKRGVWVGGVADLLCFHFTISQNFKSQISPTSLTKPYKSPHQFLPPSKFFQSISSPVYATKSPPFAYKISSKKNIFQSPPKPLRYKALLFSIQTPKHSLSISRWKALFIL